MRPDISFKTTPLKSSTPKKGHVLVIGGGVTGMVTSWVLLDQGYQVTVMAKQWASYGKEQRITSQIAGALWEYPPAVCGQHTDAISLHHSRRWCMLAYRIWDAIAADPDLSRDSGVRMKNSAFFFPYKMEENEEQYQKMIDIKNSGVRGFKHSSSLIEHYGISPDYGCEDGYELVAPVIDTDTAMSWLMGLVGSKGAKFVTEAIDGDLFNHEHSLRERFGADIIVNATGLAGRELAGDTSCYPIRGGLMRVINDGSDFEKLDAALCISADAKHGTHTVNEIVFLVPRSDRILLLGGISEPHEWDLDHTLDTPIIKRMKDRCEAFLPRLKNARLDEEYPLAQGLRPFRACNVRVERELRRHKPGQGKNGISIHQNGTSNVLEDTDDDPSTVSRIIHSYGQGGAGWSLSFGCAGDVLALVGEALSGMPPKPMSLE
ncbi:uncharacterized protein DNG_05641 [Cephalotrichum gorgonifer]|uniref:FAD dependent oxidoreductase domain-containing protein n=1 Tax=Cephalotrichum gorgonifer TaxID=2041049 RepID=A0AAE8MYJ6_9PEZI|nr:uncharacterized protein DNG_05641 [Cephalotrichum gorgonifer]